MIVYVTISGGKVSKVEYILDGATYELTYSFESTDVTVNVTNTITDQKINLAFTNALPTVENMVGISHVITMQESGETEAKPYRTMRRNGNSLYVASYMDGDTIEYILYQGPSDQGIFSRESNGETVCFKSFL